MKKYLIAIFTLILPISVWALDEREGYSAVFEVNQPMTIFTVPQGKRFVLLQLNSHYDNYGVHGQCIILKADERIIVDGKTLFFLYGSFAILNHDFPDRCVTVNAGEALNLTLHDNCNSEITPVINIVGYFYNVICISPPVSDLNKDCKVDFTDLAILASEWLNDGNTQTGTLI
jgi:hypothetical protein